MTVLTPSLREALVRAGTSSLIGVLGRRGLRAMCLHGVPPLRAGEPRMACYTMPFIPSREDKDGGLASRNCSTVEPQVLEEWRGGKA